MNGVEVINEEPVDYITNQINKTYYNQKTQTDHNKKQIQKKIATNFKELLTSRKEDNYVKSRHKIKRAENFYSCTKNGVFFTAS